jgi:cytochrome P450
MPVDPLAVLRPPYPTDPYPAHKALREAGPVGRDDAGLWLASTYEAALTVFRSPDLGRAVVSDRACAVTLVTARVRPSTRSDGCCRSSRRRTIPGSGS